MNSNSKGVKGNGGGWRGKNLPPGIVAMLLLTASIFLNLYFFKQGEYLTRTSPELADAEVFDCLSGLRANSIILVDLVKSVLGTDGYVTFGALVYEPSDSTVGEQLKKSGWTSAPEGPAAGTGNSFKQLVSLGPQSYVRSRDGYTTRLVYTPYGDGTCLVFVGAEYGQPCMRKARKI